jgi:hypothetical protein
MKVGDKVIVNKPVSGVYKQKAVIKGINERLNFYRVYRVELTESTTLSGGIACNIWEGETIELDLQETRNDKLNELGI